MRAGLIALAVLFGDAVAVSAAAQPVTTVITHGYSFDGEKGAWIEGMADAIIARAGEGAIFRYQQATGAWQLVRGELDSQQPVVLIFRWLEDFDKPGVNLGFAEAAGDALYAALRAPRFVDQNNQPMAPIDLIEDRFTHFISHSRGTCVNSEAVERFGLAGIVVDHVTTFDPHPMNGTLDPPLNFDWGDPTPVKWNNVTWADNYWRADGGFFNAADFDGIPIPNALNINLPEADLECCGYQYSHSDTHLWYHGTIDLARNPCDGEVCITDEMRERWWDENLPYETSGYYFSRIAGGSDDRSAQPPGSPPGAVERLYNGSFERQMLAGWLFHGGHLDAQVVSESGETFLKLGSGAGTSAAHNRFFLAADHLLLEYDLRVIASDPDDSLIIALVDPDAAEYELARVALNPPGNWQRKRVALIGTDAPRDERYTLVARIETAGAQNAIAGIDALRIVSRADLEPAALTDLAMLDGFVIAGGIAEMQSSDDQVFEAEARVTGEAHQTHLLGFLLGADTGVQNARALAITIEARISDLEGLTALFLRDWRTKQMEQVDDFTVGITEAVHETIVPSAARFVRASDGRIELEFKQIVLLPFTLNGFHTLIDLLEIRVR